MAKYRKRNSSDTWHWCRNCTNWPISDYAEREAKPTSGELCDQCLGKENNNNCTRG